jgi:hypothetical protein
MHTVLVVGGTGFFGHRIAASLAKTPGVNVLLAGRRQEQLDHAAKALGLTREHAVAIDVNSPQLSHLLAQMRVNTLIHTAGPFQNQQYMVARASIAAGCNYIDLADGRGFVGCISTLDALARERGVSVISGASTVPALSSAVIDRHAPQFQRLDTIRFGISSGSKVPGLATVQGVLSYCGKPFRAWEHGKWTTRYGWLDLRRHRFPAPVGVRWISRCDIPDLDLFPRRYPTVRTVEFHAGSANVLGQWTVWSLAQGIRRDLLSSAAPFAHSLTRMAQWMESIGTDKGAMFVTLEGVDHHLQPLRITWNLIARQNHGPYIPCGAAIALAQKLARGQTLPTGAMPCMGLLTLDEYLQPLHALDIQHAVSV